MAIYRLIANGNFGPEEIEAMTAGAFFVLVVGRFNERATAGAEGSTSTAALTLADMGAGDS